MITTKNQHSERLYLHRDGEEEIYIDMCPTLPQHQIDGVRFLFRQFKKEKPGVIINNPVGYGKTVQVAFFLNAVRKLMKNPVLILCKDDNEVENWIQTFKTWTEYNEEDIVIESSNIYVKKTIFIKNATDIAAYSRRQWGVVVVKNDFVPKELMKVPINAVYKIWLTSIDMKKDREMLNLVYGWLYSEKKFNVDSFIASKTIYEGALNKSILIDAFLEDVVIIKNDFTSPFKTQEVTQKEILNTVPKISRKNKDATGTKIKRTKRKIEETGAPACITEHTNIDIISKLDSTITNVDHNAQHTDDFSVDKYMKNNLKMKKKDYKHEMDIESFIRDKEPVVCKEYEFINDTNLTDVHSENVSFAEAVTDIVHNENYMNLEVNVEQNSESVLSNVGNVDEMKTSQINEESKYVDSKIPSDINLNVLSPIEQNGENKSNPTSASSTNVLNNDANNEKVKIKDSSSTCYNDTREESLVLKSENECQEKDKIVRDIDYKIAEMEAKALKKFKGSLLDSLF